MNDPDVGSDRLLHLAGAVCNKTASKTDYAELDAILSADADSCRHYLRYCRMHVALQFEVRADRAARKLCQRIDAPLDDVESDITISTGSAAPEVDAARSIPISLINVPLRATGFFTSGWPVAYVIATVVFAIGLVIGAIVHVSQPGLYVSPRDSIRTPNSQSPIPDPSAVVARITGMVDCVWEMKGLEIRDWGLDKRSRGEGCRESNSPLSTLPSPLLHLGDRLALRSGLLELAYDTGARVILQGPVTYEVESSAGGYLSLGKLTARLEKGSGISANPKRQRGSGDEDNGNSPLFAVRTPTAIVTDLGTEFGVAVGKDGHTTSHVYRGSVRVQAASADGTTCGEGRVLLENESACVKRGGERGNDTPVISTGPSINPTAFSREIPKRTVKALDLVDVVAGGDGFSGNCGRGIDPRSGKIVDRMWWMRGAPLRSVRQYHRVTGMPFVDGVFIPDGDNDRVQVDSAGHVFEDFQGTANVTWQPIWAGGAMPMPSNIPSNGTWPSGTMGGIDYAASSHRLLFLHANSAITFDLEAIRRANTGHRLLRFRAAAGDVGSDGDIPTSADIRVLVDGQTRFQRREINKTNGVFSVLAAIRDEDRFLTLAATSGKDGIEFDWILFGDPRLDLLPLEAKRQRATKEP